MGSLALEVLGAIDISSGVITREPSSRETLRPSASLPQLCVSVNGRMFEVAGEVL